MNKFFKSLMMVAALTAGLSANAAIIESQDEAIPLEIDLFADIIESYRVTIEHDDMVVAAPGDAMGSINLNGTGSAGFDGLLSVAALGCRDNVNAQPMYSGMVACSLSSTSPGSENTSNSRIDLGVQLEVKVELSGPGDIDLTASLGGASAAGASTDFVDSAVEFSSNGSTSVAGMVDQDTDTLIWNGSAPLNGGPDYGEHIEVAITKN